ncbi:MAG: hypothetical protein DHS20C13_04480 [Thermodesulfobacteriota bacterium]|nr:MAG: hypothetical protein DHS20C13_04480 [Thermodesulfobacteriota bacterium]
MSRQKHEVIEIMSYVPEVIIDASDWSVEDIQNFASTSSISNSKLVIKNTKHLTCDELERIIKIDGSSAKNNNVAIEL